MTVDFTQPQDCLRDVSLAKLSDIRVALIWATEAAHISPDHRQMLKTLYHELGGKNWKD